MSSRRSTSVIAIGAVALFALAGCSGGNSANNGGESSGSDSLVIDTAFSIETADPGHTYDPTGNMIAKALYETLVDFEGSDVSTPVPGLASWEQNDEATEFTFTLEGDRVFSDGSPIEAKDVVFTLQRIQGMDRRQAELPPRRPDRSPRSTRRRSRSPPRPRCCSCPRSSRTRLSAS